ncbi:MAG: VWA domain-containing protein [bacterium]|nr:VWA domain-containing protein [bacterium]
MKSTTTTLVFVLAVSFLGGLSPAAAEKPKVELAILLDTSNSMDGLIDQARSELWQVVNELTESTRDGEHPELLIALFEYGNDRLPSEGGHVRRVLAFTSDLDRVSEELFALTTNGGSEYCGKVISDAIDELEWSSSSKVLKLVFIAGNEPFDQGTLNFRAACKAAIGSGVVVNTIHCGDHETGVKEHWREGARLTGGEYLSIDHNREVVHITAPQDDEIARLNIELNATYVVYGAEGAKAQERQMAQDLNAQGISSSTISARTKTKASANYVNSTWDLVDATKNQALQIEEIDTEDLPKEMRSMTKEQRLRHVESKRADRKRIQAEIQRLSDERDLFVAEQRQLQAEAGEDTLDQAMIKAIHEQGNAIGLEF